MTRYRVQIVERVIHQIEVEAEDPESAREAAYAIYEDDDWALPVNACVDSANAELVHDLDADEAYFFS